MKRSPARRPCPHLRLDPVLYPTVGGTLVRRYCYGCKQFTEETEDMRAARLAEDAERRQKRRSRKP